MDFNLKDHTILLTLAGSRAYGTSLPTSDIDIKGICIPPSKYRNGFLNQFEQADKPSHMAVFVDLLKEEEQNVIKTAKLEGSVYDIRKFFKLASDCNPNILDTLFCRDSEIILNSKAGNIIRENRDLFLSKKARFTFHGFAIAQLKRIETHRNFLFNPPKERPTRAAFKLPESYSIPKEQLDASLDAVKKKIDSWEIDFGNLEYGMVIHIQEQLANYMAELQIASNEKFAAAARLLGYSDNFIYLLQCEREYKHAMIYWAQYNDWKTNRNPERAALEEKYGYDCKHAGHLVRLTRMCREILESGKVNVCRNDADEILSIRNGDWSYDKLMDFVNSEHSSINDRYKKSTLPHSPDRNKLDNLCIELVENYEKTMQGH